MTITGSAAMVRGYSRCAANGDHPAISPMLAAKQRFEPFSAPGWVFDLKHDGWRAIVARNNDAVRIVTRNGMDITSMHPAVVEAVLGLACPRFVLDGELCVRDGSGVSRLSYLMSDRAAAEFIAFDLLMVGDVSAVHHPLSARRQVLSAVLESGGVEQAECVVGDGEAFFAQAAAGGFEGVVAKDLTSRYVSGRSSRWRKIKPARRT